MKSPDELVLELIPHMKWVDDNDVVRNADGSRFVWDGTFTCCVEERQKLIDAFEEESK